MKKLKPISKLKKQADAVFSKWIRERDKGICYTCGIKKDPKEMQNGHYMSRNHTNTRYSEKNCHCQCVACNMFRSGNMQLYAIRLETQYGQGILKELFREAHTLKKCDREFLNNIIEKYNLI